MVENFQVLVDLLTLKIDRLDLTFQNLRECHCLSKVCRVRPSTKGTLWQLSNPLYPPGLALD